MTTPGHFTDLDNAARLLLNAHAAVVRGIATAGEKHRAKKQEEYHKLEAERKLMAGRKPVNG